MLAVSHGNKQHEDAIKSKKKYVNDIMVVFT